MRVPPHTAGGCAPHSIAMVPHTVGPTGRGHCHPPSPYASAARTHATGEQASFIGVSNARQPYLGPQSKQTGPACVIRAVCTRTRTTHGTTTMHPPAHNLSVRSPGFATLPGQCTAARPPTASVCSPSNACSPTSKHPPSAGCWLPINHQPKSGRCPPATSSGSCSLVHPCLPRHLPWWLPHGGPATYALAILAMLP